jgi:poly(hydroxyalkanoate) granule-associated protein
MVKKLKELVTPEQNALVDSVLASAQQIWVAGLGAFARAQKEGGEMFEKLVQEGGELQKLTQQLKPEKSFAVGEAVAKFAENVGKHATGGWDKLDKMFADRVARALGNLGVPSREDIAALTNEVASLKSQVAALAPKAPARKAAKTAAKPAGKTASKLTAKGAALKGTGRASAVKRNARAATRH